MIELLFIEAQYQCGNNGQLADIQIEVVQTLPDNSEVTLDILTVGQKAMLDITAEEIGTLTIIPTQLTNGNCIRGVHMQEMAWGDAPPPMPGFQQQTSIQHIYETFVKDSYEGLWLFEFGFANGKVDKESDAYDLNDAVLRFDLDPTDAKKTPVFGD